MTDKIKRRSRKQSARDEKAIHAIVAALTNPLALGPKELREVLYQIADALAEAGRL